MEDIIASAEKSLKLSIFEDGGKFYARRFKDEEAGGGWERQLLVNSQEELLALAVDADRKASLTWMPAIIKCGWMSTYFKIGVAALETGEVRGATSAYESCFLLGTNQEMEIGLNLLSQNPNLTSDEVIFGIEKKMAEMAAEEKAAEEKAIAAPFIGCDWGYFYMEETLVSPNKKIIGRFSAPEMVNRLDKDDLIRWAQNPVGYFIQGWDENQHSRLASEIEAAISKRLFGK